MLLANIDGQQVRTEEAFGNITWNGGRYCGELFQSRLMEHLKTFDDIREACL